MARSSVACRPRNGEALLHRSLHTPALDLSLASAHPSERAASDDFPGGRCVELLATRKHRRRGQFPRSVATTQGNVGEGGRRGIFQGDTVRSLCPAVALKNAELDRKASQKVGVASNAVSAAPDKSTMTGPGTEDGVRSSIR